MNIYEQYGKLMVQKEILDNKIMEIKGLIAKETNKPKDIKETSEKPENKGK